jgi:hypothetical protein
MCIDEYNKLEDRAVSEAGGTKADDKLLMDESCSDSVSLSFDEAGSSHAENKDIISSADKRYL